MDVPRIDKDSSAIIVGIDNHRVFQEEFALVHQTLLKLGIPSGRIGGVLFENSSMKNLEAEIARQDNSRHLVVYAAGHAFQHENSIAFRLGDQLFSAGYLGTVMQKHTGPQTLLPMVCYSDLLLRELIQRENQVGVYTTSGKWAGTEFVDAFLGRLGENKGDVRDALHSATLKNPRYVLRDHEPRLLYLEEGRFIHEGLAPAKDQPPGILPNI